MAFNITTNYVGQDAMVWIGAALLGGDTLEQQLLTILPNVKKATTLHKLSMTDLVQTDSCSFSPSGDVTITDKQIDPVAQKVNLELCKTDLEQHWISAQMRAGANNDDIPAELADFILEYVAKKVAAHIDALIWKGEIAFGDDIDGLTRLMFDDIDVVKPAAVAITPANVIAQLQAVYDVIPDEILMSTDLKLLVSNNVAKAYKQAVAAQSAETYFVGARPLDFLGLPLVPIRGMFNNTIVAAETTNLFFATDLMSDFNEAKVIDMSETTGDDTVRIKMRFKLQPQFAFGSQIVLHQVGLV